MASISSIITGAFNQKNKAENQFKNLDNEANIEWIEKEKLIFNDEDFHFNFGRSVSIDGNYAVIGQNGYIGGAAHIYKKNGSKWIHQTQILPGNDEFNKHFGNSVSIEGDTVLIGESSQGYPYHTDYGSAYVFKKDINGQWNQVSKLSPTKGCINDFFGCSVSLSKDTALIGASGDNIKGADTGSAYIFKYNGTGWHQKEMLIPNDSGWGDNFGISVSLDGDTALIGSLSDNEKGSAYIFKYNGTKWNQEAKLIPSNSTNYLMFGYSVSLDGNTALIGAPGNYKNTGSAFIFKYNGNLWVQQAKLNISSQAAYDHFGISVSIDGDTALIGETDSDFVYVFKRYGSKWNKEAKLYSSDDSSYKGFGCSVSIDEDTAFIGAENDRKNGSLSGAAYIYLRDKTNPYVKIINPKSAIYLAGKVITPYFFPVIVGNIEIQATAEDDLEIERLEFYINDEYIANCTEDPYIFLWNEISFGKYTINAVAYDSVGKIGEDILTVLKFF